MVEKPQIKLLFLEKNQVKGWGEVLELGSDLRLRTRSGKGSLTDGTRMLA